MRQSELKLSVEDRRAVESFRRKGLHNARALARANILCALDDGIAEAQIMAVLNISRTVIWRTRSAYIEAGINFALHDAPRTGQPQKYATDVEAKVTALACSTPPDGRKRWTISLLTQAAQHDAEMACISPETVRRMLKKTASNHGAF